MSTPADDDEAVLATAVRTRLLAAPYSRTVSVFPGPVRSVSKNSALANAVPDQAVFCMFTGGFQMLAFRDGGRRSGEERPTAIVTVRSNPRDYDAGRALALDVYACLDMLPPSGFFEARCQGSQPMYLNMDAEQHHQWSINVWLRRHIQPSS